MTKKLPHCAYCGEPLAGSSRRIVETWADLPGGPSFGWHMQNNGVLGCYEKDKRLGRMTAAHLMINTIAARGLNRVVFTRKIK